MASGHLLLSCAKRAATTKIDLFAYLWQLPCALCSLILMTLLLGCIWKLMMWPAARDFCVAQDIFSQEYWRISRKNDAAHRKKARCPGALGVFRYTLRAHADCGMAWGSPDSRLDVWKEIFVLQHILQGLSGSVCREHWAQRDSTHRATGKCRVFSSFDIPTCRIDSQF